MSVVRHRKEAAKRLALALQANYRALAEARGEEEITNASIVLGSTFNDNIEFVINVLRDYGGLEAKFEPMTRAAGSAPPPPANDLPKTPAIFSAGADVDLRKKPH